MKNKLLGELESKVMSIVWDAEGSLRPHDVSKLLGGTYAYSTVVTILTRLYQKELLKREKVGKVFTYSPNKSREQFASTRLKNLFDGIINDFGSLAISQFVDSIGDNPEDLKQLRNYLNKK